ncbi:MAG: M1 family metallopeptidase [Deltaproteobacteria bacterium]|nr:M1 family metallopeptidase [Deltaproteobacteria bacterium]
MACRWLALLVLASCGPAKPNVTVPAPVSIAADPSTAPDAGSLTPPQPTLRLPKNFVPTSYDARLTIDPKRPTFDGVVAIVGDVSELSSVIWLHGTKLTIKRAFARKGSGTELPITVTAKEPELLEVRPEHPLEPGEWTLVFEYSGAFDTNNTAGAFQQTVAGQSYVYSQLEATYARRVFPCVDEPDNKVPWKLTLDVPKDLVAVSNTPATEAPLGAAMKRVEFAQTRSLPTYLVAFGVGPFEIVDAGKTRNGAPIRIVTLAKRSAETAWAAKTTAPLVEALEDWFGTPYPYDKLDMLTIPLTVGFGAMENAGLITFTETLILGDPVKQSKARQHSWVVVAAHEIAHQWFGNLVTMKYWDDIWLNEGFANWVMLKVTSKIDPTYKDDQGVLDMRNGALGADGLVSARQIRQPIETADDIAGVFDGITYNKGAAVLNMFERYVGAATFQQGVRDYLKNRAWGNATSKDFVSAIAAADGGKHGDIESAFATFLDRPGAPEITASISCKGTGAKLEASVALAQKRYVPLGAPTPPASGPWAVPVCVVFDQAGKRAEACTLLSAETGALALPANTSGPTKTCPRWVMPNVDGRSYYRTAYTTQQITTLRDVAWGQLSWSERRAVFFDVQEGVSSGRVPLQLALSFIPKLLAGNDRFTIEQALGLANGVEWLVADELRGKYEYWLRTTFGAAATAAGFEPKASDTLDLETTRNALVSTVAWTARDPVLVAEAVRLAARYKDLPQSTRGMVLSIAVDAKPEIYQQIKKDLAAETDRTRREEMISALASTRDPVRHKATLELVLDPKLDIRETQSILWTGSTDATREMGRAYFMANDAAILERMPPDGTAGQISGFAYLFVGTCKAERRNEVAAYIAKTFGTLPGGARNVKQATESLDQCIAKRKVTEAEVKAWLSGLRLPKPKR